MNQINAISPYRHNGFLVFDDPDKGLSKEPFVGGADVVLQVAASISKVNPNKFNLLFSGEKFPGWKFKATITNPPETIGTWYKVDLTGGREAVGWLCPALLKYFKEPPQQIFFQIKESA